MFTKAAFALEEDVDCAADEVAGADLGVKDTPFATARQNAQGGVRWGAGGVSFRGLGCLWWR